MACASIFCLEERNVPKDPLESALRHGISAAQQDVFCAEGSRLGQGLEVGQVEEPYQASTFTYR